MTSAIGPGALQYASKFSNSNNNVIITSTIVGLSNVSGPSNSTVVLPQGGLHLQSHHHNNTSTHASSNSSTTTTFYSGVKLAPPVLSASVEQLERRASDQKVWYTIQVCPCDLTIITPASTSASTSASSSAGPAMGTSSGGCSGGSGGTVTSIPRKSYKIYRRYEDVADFADQLEEEFTGRMVAPSAGIDLQHDTKDYPNVASTATSTSGGGFGSSSYCVNGNMPGSGSIAFTEKGMMDGGASATNTNNNAVTLPRLKSRLVLFVTKAVCLQRKEELDRYLQELFALGPIIAHSRLVAEFFGIWKTDMEVHLSQEDRDPLALHSVAAITTVFDNEKDSNMDLEHESEEAENGEDAAKREALQDRPTSTGEPVTETTMMDSSLSALTATSPSPLIPSPVFADILDAHSTYNYSSSSTVDPTSFSTNSQALSSATTMTNTTSTYLASPSLSPSSTAYDLQDVGWTPSLSTLLPLTTETGTDVDAVMVSPTEPTAPFPLPLGHSHLEPAADGYESGTGTETEILSDLTTRTIKKFKSLRRSHTSSSHSRQQQQQDSNVQEDSNPGPTGRSGSVSGPSGGGAAVPLTTTVTQPKSKIMKRSKTIVFRPEVTMQPLSSKNVIPPWNRIPSFANNNSSNNSGATPISPISPTTPQSATAMSGSSGGSTPNTVASDQAQTPSPSSSDMDGQQQHYQPRKLTMSHSKTMSSISTTPSWPFGNNNNSVDHSILAPGSLAGLSSSSVSSSNTANTRNGSITSTRSMSISTGMTPATLVAPWNRANGNGDTNTHLHSLIKMSGQPSPSLQSPLNSPFVPVELGRSFHKKESQSQRSPSNRGTNDRAVPVLTQPPEARNKNQDATSLSSVSGSTMKCGSGGGRARKPGMTHSVSAPGGFLPIMTVSAPDSSTGSASASMAEDVSGQSVKAAATRKRVSLHSPCLPTKQPVGILKNAQRGTRKASLTVPGAVMFPVQSSPTAIASACSTLTSSSSPSTPTTAVGGGGGGGGGGTHGTGTLATTFKIVMDADTIVALQVLEDSSFVLTMPELRSRVKAKLTKSNIQLPDKFDLLWTVTTNSMTLASPSPSTPTSGMSAMSINQASAALDQGVMLKTDEDLHRAIHASRNHKVTLRCIL
ncbi:hypothetical protein KI688_002387 [Linnemannia hyalina]|uniref:PX domain-containing protein n=1 Tax=Linnemannia hyalina TaxID=64524 RepID=A0A9P8BRJ1_9FUNG|nr:hypothetical protein KI688_002387 [Linnemannia hyalina]